MNHHSRIQALLDKLSSSYAGLKGILVSEPHHVRYLTGFTGDSSYLLLTSQQRIILSDRRYEEQLAQECSGFELAIRGPEKLMPQLCQETLLGCGYQQIGVEEDHLSAGFLRRLRETMAKAQVELVSTVGLVESLRACKDEQEISILRRAVEIAEMAFEQTLAEVQPDWSELQVAWRLEHHVRNLEGEGLGFPAIVASGPGAALPHYQTCRRKIGDHPLLLVDWGAKYEGYTSDLTRTVWLNTPGEEMQRVFDIVQEAHDTAIAAIRPGVSFEEVDRAARLVIERAGYGTHFNHGLGHGIGLQIHEYPRMAANQKGLLEVGMVVTVEPGIYLPGIGGVRIEDDCLVQGNGCDVLSRLPLITHPNCAHPGHVSR
jgi:Xaa-Pro aminopeptidase